VKVAAITVVLVTVLALVVRKRTAVRWVVAVLVFRRIRAAAEAVIGVVGLRVTLRNLIARELVAIPVVVVALATPQQK
jgi:ABC-type nickel/cobalt efflux system permease component RcnA